MCYFTNGYWVNLIRYRNTSIVCPASYRYCLQGNIRPCFIFAPFAEFKTWRIAIFPIISLLINTTLFGQIQDWAKLLVKKGENNLAYSYDVSFRVQIGPVQKRMLISWTGKVYDAPMIKIFFSCLSIPLHAIFLNSM